MADCLHNRSPAEHRAWMARLRQREREAKGKRWQHVDGGCMLCPKPGGGYKPKGRFPCDDSYQDKTGREVTFPVTECRHWEMPFGFDSPTEVKRLSGVGPAKYTPPPTPREKACQEAAHKAIGPWKVGRMMDMRKWRKVYKECLQRKAGD